MCYYTKTFHARSVVDFGLVWWNGMTNIYRISLMLLIAVGLFDISFYARITLALSSIIVLSCVYLVERKRTQKILTLLILILTCSTTTDSPDLTPSAVAPETTATD